MAKRIVSLVLAAVLLLACVPVTAAAADEVPVLIRAWNQEHRMLTAYEDGGDLLFSMEDLAWLSGTEVRKDGNRIIFTRGAKTVTVYVRDPEVISDDVAQIAGYEESVASMDRAYGKALISPCKYVDGTWYISGASVLPWLNVHYAFGSGIFSVTPSGVSVWDMIGEFNIKDYTFDFVECCEEIGVDSKDVQSAAYIKANGLKSLLDLDINNSGTTFRGKERYVDLFDDMFKDQSASDVSIEEIREQLETLGNLLDLVGVVVAVTAPEFAIFTDAVSYVVDAGETAWDYYAYINLFNTDNSRKLGFMETLIDETGSGSNQNMRNAAKEVKDRYTNFWKGIVSKIKYDTVDYINDQLTSKGVLKLLSLSWEMEGDVNVQIDRISPYSTIAKTCLKIYKKGFETYSQEDINDMVDSAMLYLYCIEQSYRAMATYMIEKHEGSSELVEEYVGRADAAEGTTASVENAIYLAALRDMDIENFRWAEGDLDRDGTAELIAAGMLSVDDYWEECLVMDANDMSMGSTFDDYGAAGSPIGVYQSRDGEAFYQAYGYYTAGTQSEGYLCWNGSYWEIAAEKINYTNYNETDSNGDYVVSTNYVTNISDDPSNASKEEYDSVIAGMDLGGLADFDCPQLDDRIIDGSAGEILSDLDNYFKKREGCVMNCATDLDGDGDQDRVYGIFAAISDQILYAREKSAYDGNDNAYLQFVDLDLTIVTAEPVDGGVHLRVCRLEEPLDMLVTDSAQFSGLINGTSDEAYTLEGGILTIGGNVFEYQSEGTAFRPEGWDKGTQTMEDSGRSLYSLLGCSTPEEAMQILDASFEPDENPSWTFFQGEMGEVGIDLMFDTSYPEYPYLNSLQAYPDGRSVAINAGLHTGMTRAEIWEKLTPTTAWSEPAPTYGPSNEVLYYSTTFFYLDRDRGSFYNVSIGFDSTGPDAKIVQIMFTCCASVPEEVMAELGA